MKKAFKRFVSIFCILAIFACLAFIFIGYPSYSVALADEVEENVCENDNTLINYDNVGEFEYKKFEIDVIAELNNRIERYETLLITADFKDQYKIRQLINTTKELISEYVICQSGIVIYSDDDTESSTLYTGVISTTIAGFSLYGYELAAELLTHMRSNKVLKSDYVPVFGSVVVASQITYDIAYGSSIFGGSAYELAEGQTVSEKDLFYSIHKFEYTKSSADSKKILIKDLYDFAEEKYDGITSHFVQKMYEAQQAGELIPFYTNITINVDETVRLKNNGRNSTNNGWSVAVTNPTDTEIEVFYNAKMCFERDAKNWTGLTDIVKLSIPANATKTVTVMENGLGTHVAFSRIVNDDERSIIYADNLDTNGNITPLVSKITFNYYENIGILGKYGNKWLIRLTNNFNERRLVEYNEYMCNEDDSKTWFNLAHIKEVFINAGETKDIEITENYGASHIAVRFSGNSGTYSIHANELNASGTMKIATNISSTFIHILSMTKNSNEWIITIRNPFSYSLTVEYNSKMCFDDDAKYWRGLNDSVKKTVGGEQTTTIRITENFFATSVAISYTQGRYRYITYANSLDTTAPCCKAMYNVV